MEGFRAQAHEALQELDFVRAANEHEFITVVSGETIEVKRISMPVSEIALRCKAETPSKRSFRLAKVNLRNTDPNRPWRSLNASREEILQLWQAFEMEPYQLYLLSRCVRGFQRLQLPGTFPHKQHYFANYDSHCILWTYDISSLTGSGLIVVRRRGGYEYSVFDQWFGLFTQHSGHVGHPLYPFLVSTAQILEYIYFKIDKSQSGIRAVESVSGFHPWHDRERLLDSINSIDSDGLDELWSSSKTAGAIMVELEDVLRQVKLAQRARSAFDDLCMPMDTPILQALAREAEPAVYILWKQLDSAEDVVQYLRGRATNQLTVVGFSPLLRARRAPPLTGPSSSST